MNFESSGHSDSKELTFPVYKTYQGSVVTFIVPLDSLYSTEILSYFGCGYNRACLYEKSPLDAIFYLVMGDRAWYTSSSAQYAIASDAL